VATITLFAAPAAIEHGGGTMTSAQCTEACVKTGAKYVFTSGGRVYALANQDDTGVALNAGKTVQRTGDLQDTHPTAAEQRC
jgi:hypothetical protein